MKFFENLKKKWQGLLNKLADENKKSFGEEPLDCCTMNQKKNS
ncbi:MAG: LDCC motif putative metal-binding protein [Peptoniphilus sp.]|nr:LDCC motif putative metal-binding protein [Peptoniphilus sp.]MDY3118365.1 LDCC motif putative metal-binding protein [Peptoniphilus sp.]